MGRWGVAAGIYTLPVVGHVDGAIKASQHQSGFFLRSGLFLSFAPHPNPLPKERENNDCYVSHP